MNPRLLIVDDDPVFADVLQHNLLHVGFDVQVVAGPHAAMECVGRVPPDMVLLDVSLPLVNGFELCTAWRRTHTFPIIMISARDQRRDLLTGLDAGADDYVTKPFDFDELVARIRAVLRRSTVPLYSLVLGDVTVDFARFVATRNGVVLALTAREFEILKYLAERPGRTVHRDELLCRVWGYASPPFTRAVDKAIERLRRKIEPDPLSPRFIHTAYGDGYCMTP